MNVDPAALARLIADDIDREIRKGRRLRAFWAAYMAGVVILGAVAAIADQWWLTVLCFLGLLLGKAVRDDLQTTIVRLSLRAEQWRKTAGGAS